MRLTRILQVSIVVVSLLVWAQAQHGGGGGGHGGGGHSGGGGHFGGHFGGGHSGSHSSRGHANSVRTTSHGVGRALGWIHGGSRSRSGNRLWAGATAETFYPSANATRNSARSHRFPSTYIQTIPLTPLSSHIGNERFASSFSSPRIALSRIYSSRLSSSWLRQRRRDFFFDGNRRFHRTGCFFGGFAQQCFFEPALPLFCYYGGWGWGWGWDDFGFSTDNWGNWDNGDNSQSEDMNAAGEMPEGIAPELPSESATEAENSSEPAAPAYLPKYEELDKRFFVLVLNNGATHIVTNYWLEDGYLEYISQDGSQSHIPVEALNLQDTVAENSSRGLSFVLRSAPANR